MREDSAHRMAQVSRCPSARDQGGGPLEHEKNALCCFLRRIHDPTVQPHLYESAAKAAPAGDRPSRSHWRDRGDQRLAAPDPMGVDTVVNDRGGLAAHGAYWTYVQSYGPRGKFTLLWSSEQRVPQARAARRRERADDLCRKRHERLGLAWRFAISWRQQVCKALHQETGGIGSCDGS
jgi:hypothetical protein